MGRYSRFGNDLYTGGRSIDFVGNKLVWYLVSLVLVASAAGVLLTKGVNLGIEFTGGEQISVSLPAGQVNQDTADRLREVVAGTDVEAAESPIVTTSGERILIQTEELTADETDVLVAAVIDDTGVSQDDLTISEISASWGSQVAERALVGVVVFLFLVVLFIWAYFRQWKMSVAALVALFHDITLTVGVYSLSGFTVTPAAVTGLLAILGFSLYDTVVVFDKVRENTKNLRATRQTYAQAANLALNQTLVRSVNTSIVALIPIGAILYVSAVSLGASSLQDLALAQFVGMAVGVYSSVFLAPRVLVHLKSRESDVLLAERRAKARARQADRYATVPVFADDMPIRDDECDLEDADLMPDDEGPVSQQAGPRQSDPMGRGRTAPAPRRPVGESRSSGRQQPTRQPKSQRKKP
jgi:preprotein translocase subunit SecF